MTEKINWKYKDNDRVVFNTVQSDLLSLNGCECVIERRVTEDEADLFETGPMYRLKLVAPAHRGRKIDAFEDELTPAGKITWRDLMVRISELPENVLDMPALVWVDSVNKGTDGERRVIDLSPFDADQPISKDNRLCIDFR